MKEDENATRYLFWGIILLIILLAYFVLKGFLLALVSAFILAYLLKPINNLLKKYMPPALAASISILIITLIILLTLISIIGSLISQISEFADQGIITNLVENVKDLPYEKIITDNFSEIISKAGQVFLSLISAAITEIPSRALALFVTLFTTYYLLIQWDTLKKKIADILPFKNKHDVMKKIEVVIGDVILGTFLLAIIEATIAIVGFWLLGVKFAILLGFLIGLFAFIPALGPLIIWVPVAVIEFSLGNYGTAMGVVAMGIFLSAFVDSIVRIKLIGGKSKIHPVIMLVGLLGGIQVFGLIGFILGPIILSILLIIMENIPKLE